MLLQSLPRDFCARQKLQGCCAPEIKSARLAMIAGVLLSAFVLGGLGGTAAAQDNFEPADFNVTSELLTLGVDVNALPELSGLAERDDAASCAAAVSLFRLLSLLGPFQFSSTVTCVREPSRELQTRTLHASVVSIAQ